MTYRTLVNITITGICILSTHGPASAQMAPNRFPNLSEAGQPVVREQALLNPATPSQRGPVAAAVNQRIADAIAAHLRASGQLRDYSIDISVDNGVACLRGRVASDAQRTQAVELTRGVFGVEQVREVLQVGARPALIAAQAVNGLQMPEVGPVPVPMENPMRPKGPEAGPAPGPVGSPPVLGGAYQEPEPIYRASPADMASMQPPMMPPYAWPAYAPYNNYSRVAYPTLYPYEAFPFIGPCYPYPKIPLGWRSVTLRWEDGYWWYGKNATGHDWWRIRYW